MVSIKMGMSLSLIAALAVAVTLTNSNGKANELKEIPENVDVIISEELIENINNVNIEEKNVLQGDYPIEEWQLEPETFDIVVTMTGDVMLASFKDQTKSGNFNDYVNNNDPSYFLQNVKYIFENDDLTIVNLENVLTDNNLKEVAKNHNPAYWYKSKTSNTDILTCSSVEAVSLANNHTGDYGSQGSQDTIEAVEKAGLLYGTNDKTIYYEKNGYVIAIICHGLWYEGQADAIINRLKDAETQSDFQIVFYHGGTERVYSPEEWRVRASRKLVDNGADLVIGNHPHVLQPREVYNGVDIIYSMGNFCFGGDLTPENRTIIYQFKLTVNTEDKVLENKTSEIIPCYVFTGKINNFAPAVIEDEEIRQHVLEYMEGKVKRPF